MKIIGLLIGALTLAALPLTAAPVGTAFTYQGSLIKGGVPVSTPQDFEFGIYDSASGTGQVGTTITLANVAVTNGLFNVNLDFGAGAFGTEQRFLQIMVRSIGDTVYMGLAPRAAVMPAPVALSVAAGGVSSEAIQDGAITRAKLAPSVNPKLLMSLTYDYYIYPFPEFPPFTANEFSNDFQNTFSGVRVLTPGTYVVSVRLTVNMAFSGPVNAAITRNGSTIRSLSDGTTSLPSGTTVLSSVEILQLQAFDELSIQVSSPAPGARIKGDFNRSTTFDIIRID